MVNRNRVPTHRTKEQTAQGWIVWDHFRDGTKSSMYADGEYLTEDEANSAMSEMICPYSYGA